MIESRPDLSELGLFTLLLESLRGCDLDVGDTGELLAEVGETVGEMENDEILDGRTFFLWVCSFFFHDNIVTELRSSKVGWMDGSLDNKMLGEQGQTTPKIKILTSVSKTMEGNYCNYYFSDINVRKSVYEEVPMLSKK